MTQDMPQSVQEVKEKPDPQASDAIVNKALVELFLDSRDQPEDLSKW